MAVAAEKRSAGARANVPDASVEFLRRLLPSLDSLHRACDGVPPDLATHPWVGWVLEADQELSAAFAELGVTQVGDVHERFDPARHLAVFYDERDEMAEPEVVLTVLPGYVIGARTLRPAQVGVAGPAVRAPRRRATTRRPRPSAIHARRSRDRAPRRA